MLQLEWTPNINAQKNNSRKTVRATTILRQLLDSSRRGESKSAVYIYFLRAIFGLFRDFSNNVQTKIYTADLDSPRQILVYQGLSPF